MTTTPHEHPPREHPEVVPTLHWLAGLAPTRLTGTVDEHAVQDAIAARLETAGYRTAWQPFVFPRHIYGSLAMHFGLVLALVLVGLRAPILAAIGHAVVIASFYSEAVRRRHVLRRFWPGVETRNLLATLPASGPLRRRVVCVAHVDSAYTGLMFDPDVLRTIAAPPPAFLSFLRKQLVLPTACALAFIALEALSPWISVPSWVRVLLAIPPAVVFFFNAEIVVRNRVVPGAADNLSGCAAQIVLAESWAARKPDDVELVFAFTGAEEAGTGGAAHLARTMSAEWDRSITDVLVLDTLSNGELHMLEEGELFRMEIPRRLAALTSLAALDATLPEPRPYIVPAGATDALPFLVEGYQAIALTCIDPVQHAPRNYHHPNDTADRVEPTPLRDSTRLADALLARLAQEH